MSRLRDRNGRRGDLVELRFWMEASRRGVIVSKPHERARYDFIVDCGERLWRVQVKSTSDLYGRNAYRLTACSKQRSKARAYRRREVDWIAAYVIPTQEWYIFPLREVKGEKSVYLHARSRFAKYRDAWHLLLNKPKGAKIKIEAAAAKAHGRKKE